MSEKYSSRKLFVCLFLFPQSLSLEIDELIR